MKLAILGNSHVAALKSAWDEIAPNHSDVEITFFAARGNMLSRLRLKGTELVTRYQPLLQALKATSGGQTAVGLNDYDAIFLYGIGMVTIFDAPFSNLSQAVHEQLLLDSRHTFRMTQRLKEIRQVSDGPLFVGAPPLKAAPGPVTSRNTAEYQRAVVQMQAGIFDHFNARLVSQPLETVVNDQWTDPAYAAGSLRLAIDPTEPAPDEHPHGEDLHMNTAYGKLYLSNLLSLMD